MALAVVIAAGLALRRKVPVAAYLLGTLGPTELERILAQIRTTRMGAPTLSYRTFEFGFSNKSR
jgi:hypothetical protein